MTVSFCGTTVWVETPLVIGPKTHRGRSGAMAAGGQVAIHWDNWQLFAMIRAVHSEHLWQCAYGINHEGAFVRKTRGRVPLDERCVSEFPKKEPSAFLLTPDS